MPTEMEWFDIYNEANKLKSGGTDDEYRGFFKNLDEKLKSGDDEGLSEELASDLRKKYKEFAEHGYEFGVDAGHVAIYAVNIVCDVSSMLFSAFKLMFENMRPSPRSRYSGEENSNSWGPNSNDYDNDFGKDKQKGRRKEKDTPAREKRARKDKSKGELGDRDMRSTEKSRRQEAAREINSNRASRARYEGDVRRRASQKERSSELSEERGMSKF